VNTRTKLLLSLFLVGLLPIVVALATYAVTARRTDVVQDDFAHLAEDSARTLGYIIEDRSRVISAIATDNLFQTRGASLQETEAELSHYLRLFPEFEELALVALDGNPIASAPNSYLQTIGSKKALCETYKNHSVGLGVELSVNNGAVFSLTAPVYGSDGSMLAVLMGRTTFSGALDQVREPGLDDCDFMVVDSEGSVVQAYDTDSASAAASVPVAVLYPSGIKGTQVAYGPKHLYASVKVPGLPGPYDWAIVARIPIDVAYAQTSHIRRYIIIIAGVALLAVTLSSALATRILHKPFLSTAVVARSIAAGNFSKRIPVPESGELGEAICAFNDMADKIEAMIEELKESRQRIVRAQETVMKDISGQLHGTVQTRLLLLWHRLNVCEKLIRSDPEKAITEIRDIASELDKVREHEIRGISHRLHPGIIRMGLLPALSSIRDGYANVMNITLEVCDGVTQIDMPGQSGFDEKVVLVVYRVVEEALANAVKHGEASATEVSVSIDEAHSLNIAVKDNGKGFDSENTPAGHGIQTISDYISVLEGTFAIESEIGEGTTLSVKIPHAFT
jgi:signal transduction histidine kinase